MLSLYAAKCVDAKNAYIGGAKSFCIKNTYVSNIYTRNTYAKNIVSTIVACIKGVCLNITNIKSANRQNSYIKSIYTIEYSKIYLQFFSILEINLFDIG